MATFEQTKVTMFVGFIAIFLAYCYSLLVLFAVRGWKLHDKAMGTEHSYPFCSVVIAARNEAESIRATVESLLAQNYPKDCYEILVIDDHSTDATKQILDEIAATNTILRVFSAPDGVVGKKQALKHVLQHASGDYLLFTDADCFIGKNWIETYITYASTHKGNLYFGNICPNITSKSSFIEKCAALDFIGILGVQNGLAKIGHAFSCNGANMCITKDFYSTSYKTNETFSSGDDVFLLHSAKQIDTNSIHFIQNEQATVGTNVPRTISAFFNQRCRWASKANGYKDKDAILVAFIVYVYCLALTIAGGFACFGNKTAFACFIFLFLVKLCIDFILFFTTRTHFKSGRYIWLAIPFECVYFLYITIVPIASIFYKTKWKERTIN